MTRLATVILAAGKGTRMKSDLPKVLHQVAGKTMLEYVIERAHEIGSNHIVVIVGHQAERVEQTIQALNYKFPIYFVKQEPQLGTGHAVLQAKAVLMDHLNYRLHDQVLVLSGDVPLIKTETLRKLLVAHDKHEITDGTVLAAKTEDPTGFGRIVRHPETGRLQEIVEEKDIISEEIRQINEINTGTYVFQADKLFLTLPQVNNQNKQGEYYLPDVIKIWTKYGRQVEIALADFDETQGVNTVEQLKKVEKLMLEKI